MVDTVQVGCVPQYVVVGSSRPLLGCWSDTVRKLNWVMERVVCETYATIVGGIIVWWYHM